MSPTTGGGGPVGLFWLLLFPAAFIVIFGFLSGGGNDLHATVGVVGGDSSPVARQMTGAIKDPKFFTAQSGTEKSEFAKLRADDLDAVVVFPAQTGSRANEGQPLQVRSYVDRSNVSTSHAVSGALGEIAQGMNRPSEALPQTVAVSTRGVEGQHLSFMDFLVPGILAMSIMQGPPGLPGSFVVLRERGVLRRIRATPFPLAGFIGARVVSQLLVSLAQATLLLTLAKLPFGLHIVGNFVGVAAFILLGSLAFLTVGFLVASVTKKQETAIALAYVITFPTLFFSGIFFPRDQSPVWLQDLARALPLSYFADGLRQVMIYSVSFDGF